ncbi:MAG: FAD-linked oxidase C-terminal domain-containing protein, partial [Gammaproteobacteria bacterium]
ARKIVRRRLAGIAQRLTFMTLQRARLLQNVSQRVLSKKRAASVMLSRIAASLEILAGRPNRMAHPVVYWRRGGEVDIDAPLDPARDGCGLIWYAPLVPFKPETVTSYVERCTEVLREYGMEPLITLSKLSDRCLDSSVPLLFDARKPAEIEKAHRCYDALVDMGRELGVAPYRLHVGAMGRFARNGETFWDLVRTLKHAVDPDNILSPGRYVAAPGTAATDPDKHNNAACQGDSSIAGLEQ